MHHTPPHPEIPTCHCICEVSSSEHHHLQTARPSQCTDLIGSFLACRKLLKEVVLLAEIEHEEVTEELAALYTAVLLQPCQASLKSCAKISLCIAIKLLTNVTVSIAFRGTGHLRRLGGRKCELTVFLPGCRLDIQDFLLPGSAARFDGHHSSWKQEPPNSRGAIWHNHPARLSEPS